MEAIDRFAKTILKNSVIDNSYNKLNLYLSN